MKFYLAVHAPEARIRILHISVPIANGEFGNLERSDYETDFRSVDLTGMDACTRTMVQQIFAGITIIRGFHLDSYALGIEINSNSWWTPSAERELIAIILEARKLERSDMTRVLYHQYQELFPQANLLPPEPLSI